MSKNKFMPLKKFIGFMLFLASINSPLWSAAESYETSFEESNSTLREFRPSFLKVINKTPRELNINLIHVLSYKICPGYTPWFYPPEGFKIEGKISVRVIKTKNYMKKSKYIVPPKDGKIEFSSRKIIPSETSVVLGHSELYPILGFSFGSPADLYFSLYKKSSDFCLEVSDSRIPPSIKSPRIFYLEDKLFSMKWDTTELFYDYYSRFFESLYGEFGLNLKDIRTKRKMLMDRSKSLLKRFESHPPEANKIPRIIHRCWITSEETPHEIPDERLDLLIHSSHELPEWEKVLWCLDKSKIPKSVGIIEHSDCGLKIRELREIWPYLRGRDVYRRFYEDKRYTACSDIVRFNLIDIFGGFYMDLGITINPDLLTALRYWDYVTGQEGYICSTGFIGSYRKSKVLKNLLEFIDNIDRVKPELREVGSGITTPSWTALGMLTVMIDWKASTEDNILPIPYDESTVKVRSMASWLGKGSFGQKSLQLNPLTPSLFFGEAPWSDGGYRFNSEGWFLKYSLPMCEKIFGISPDMVAEKRCMLMRRCKEEFFTIKSAPEESLPLISHRAWLTDEDSPHEVPLDKLEGYFASIRTLSTTPGWRHLFWCLDPERIPLTILRIVESGLEIEIHKIDEIYSEMRGKHIFRAMLEDKRYTNANDISRLNIIDIFGGIYCDIGMEMLRDISPFMRAYDNVFWLRDWGDIDHCLFAARTKDKFLETLLGYIDNLYSLPDDYKGITPTPESQLAWTGCHFLMAVIDSLSTGSEKILFLRDGHMVKLNRLESWGSKPKFGNKSILDSKLNVIELRP